MKLDAPSSSPSIRTSDDRISWSLIFAALAAMGAMYVTSGQRGSAAEGNQVSYFIGLPIMAVLLVASRFTHWRLPRSRVVSWSLRAGILAVVITIINGQSDRESTVWYLRQDDMNIAGYALAADLVLRAWERRDPAKIRETFGTFILITACLFTAATHTYERRPIQLITPIYCVFTLLALRSMSRLDQRPGAVRTVCGGLVILRAFAVIIALGSAYTGVYLITRYEYAVTRWAVNNLTRKHGRQNEVGFSTSPRLTSVFNPEPSISRVLLIDGDTNEEHLRVMAFDKYVDQQWLPALGDRAFHNATVTSAKVDIAGMQQHITRLADVGGLVALPLESVKIDADPLQEDDLGTLRDADPKANGPYDVLVAKQPEFQGPLAFAPSADERQRLLEIPREIDPKVIAQAKNAAGAGPPATQLIRLQQQLDAHHQYSLAFSPQGEPINDFILNNRNAHCQYFASAMVIMARAVGIPARYVNGYYAHEHYGDNQMIVRQRDAHAWAECWVDGIGWLTVDATPASGRPDGIFKDPPAWQRWWEKLSDLPTKFRQWLGDKYAWIGPGVAVIAALALTIWIVQFVLERRRKPKLVSVGYAQPDADLLALSQRFEQWLRIRGMPCPPQRTWRDHLATMLVDSTAKRFVDAYDCARFGGKNGETVEMAAGFLAEIERQAPGGRAARLPAGAES
jgi:Transglutaminase-like superfamily